MAPRYLLDANTVSESLRPRPDPRVLERLHVHRSEVAVCAPVWSEVLFGVQRMAPSARRQMIEEFLNDVVLATMPILPFDQAAAEWQAAERVRLERIGLPRPYADSQIAAIAATNNLTLVTSNTRDFAPFQGLRVEDWRV